ncbi:MAG TPA: hypothetical protein VGJ48_27020 [Pyrinomonadaceae bacterium]|jgi:hypothetical protein
MKKAFKFILLMLGIVLHAGCFSHSTQSTVVITEEQLRACGTKMHVSFPASTQPLGIQEVTGWLDDQLYLKLQIPNQDLESFLRSSPFAGKQLRTDRSEILDDKNLSWWRPESVKKFKSGQAVLPDAKYLKILVDLDSDDKTIIYLAWFDT